MLLDPIPPVLTARQMYSETPVPVGGTAAAGRAPSWSPLPMAPQTRILQAARSSS